MLKFKEFISEQVVSSVDAGAIDTDSRILSHNKDAINAELEVLTVKPYQNSPLFLTQLRGCLERYGILIPASATQRFMDLGAELVYSFEKSPLYLYIVYDTNEQGFVDGYAQIVDDVELRDLKDMDKHALLDKDPIEMKKFIRFPPARYDDDSGDDSEYA